MYPPLEHSRHNHIRHRSPEMPLVVVPGRVPGNISRHREIYNIWPYFQQPSLEFKVGLLGDRHKRIPIKRVDE